MLRKGTVWRGAVGLSIVGISIGLSFGTFGQITQASPRQDPCPLGIPKPSKATQVVRYEKYGFSFEIPANYKMNSDGISDLALRSMLQCYKINRVKLFDIGETIHILIKPVPAEVKSLNDLGNPERYKTISGRKEIKFGFQTGIRYQREGTGDTGDKSLITEFITSDKRYMVTIFASDYDTPYHLTVKQVYNQVIKSLKFNN